MKTELSAAISKQSTIKKRADGTPYSSLSVAQTARLAGRFGISARQVDVTALENRIIPERYSRNIKTLSAQDQIRLLQSRVSVIGLGGLGGTVTEILARIGVGTLTLVDGDTFDDSNLNRQLLSGETGLGASKAVAARQRVRQINATVTVQAERTYLTEKNAPPHGRRLTGGGGLPRQYENPVHCRG